MNFPPRTCDTGWWPGSTSTPPHRHRAQQTRRRAPHMSAGKLRLLAPVRLAAVADLDYSVPSIILCPWPPQHPKRWWGCCRGRPAPVGSVACAFTAIFRGRTADLRTVDLLPSDTFTGVRRRGRRMRPKGGHRSRHDPLPSRSVTDPPTLALLAPWGGEPRSPVRIDACRGQGRCR